MVSRTGDGDQAGDGIDVVFGAFAAVVVGGTSVIGGRGAIWRTALGVLFLALIPTASTCSASTRTTRTIIQGAIILTAVAIDALSRRAT